MKDLAFSDIMYSLSYNVQAGVKDRKTATITGMLVVERYGKE